MNFKEMANKFVQINETLGLEQLAHDAINAHQRAEGCGCLQCQKAANGAIDRFSREDMRVNTWSPDQEDVN